MMDKGAAHRLEEAIREVAGFRVLRIFAPPSSPAYEVEVQDRITSLKYTVTSPAVWVGVQADCAEARRRMARTNRVPASAPTTRVSRTATTEEPVTTIIHATAPVPTTHELPPPPRVGGRNFGASLREFGDSLRAERERILRDRAETDSRLREIAAELAALDAAERVYRKSVDGAAVSRPRALPAPRDEAPQRSDGRTGLVGAGKRNERDEQIEAWASKHSGTVLLRDLAQSRGEHPSVYARAMARLQVSGAFVLSGPGVYRRA